MILPVLYDTFVKFDPKSASGIQPNLAESWTISSDGLSYVFTLRKNVKATTGKTLTAYDAEFCFNRLINLKGNPSFLAEPIAGIKATGEYELTVTLNEVTPAIFALLAEAAFAVYDSDAAKINGATGDPATDHGQRFFDGASIGSGPFVLDTYTPNEVLILKKNPNYWGTPAKIDTIILQQMSDPSMQLMSIQKGDIDFAFDLTAAHISSLDTAKVTVNTFPTFDIFFLMMNVTPAVGKQFADARVREAMYYALDYEGLCAIAGNGTKTPYNIIPNGFVGYLGESRIKRDIAKAKELLTQAGFPNGFSFDCGVIPDMAPAGVSFMDCAVKIQADLKEAGVTMNILPDEVSVYLDKMRNAKYQSCVNMWGPDYNDPATQLAFLPGETVGLRSSWAANMAPDLAKLCVQAKAATDPDQRVALIRQIQELYTQLAGPSLVFLQPYRSLPVTKRIQNLEYTPSQMVNLAVLDTL
ncbi:ABC transporter substrate-binding protein [Spirochaetia bacterium]|nr:ABC transporter substrate-binding protein [Spirochaetia bacterium]